MVVGRSVFFVGEVAMDSRKKEQTEGIGVNSYPLFLVCEDK